MFRSLGALALVICFTIAATTQAQVILGNYPPANDSATTADVDNLRWKALSFAMPAGPGIEVGPLIVRLGNYASASDMPIFEIRDHTGSTTAPGLTVLLSFIAPGPGTATIQDFTFTPGASFMLAGGTSYWLLMRGADAATSVDWRGSSPAIVPTGIATYGGQSLFTTNGGTSWTTSATINSFQLNAVPEPSSLGLAAIGILTCLRRRR